MGSRGGYMEIETITDEVNENIWPYFNLKDDPFDFIFENTEEFEVCKKAIRNAQKRGRMLCLVGDVGCGKTTLLSLIAADPQVTLVYPSMGHQYELTNSIVRRTLIRQLRTDGKDAKISGYPEKQMQEIGELLHARRAAGETVIMAYDDGQDFRREVLRGLKRLRDICYWGRKRLMEVLVLTHASGANRIKRIEELAKRFLFKKMVGFSRGEVKAYIARALGGLFEDKRVIDAFARYTQDRRPLSVQHNALRTLQRVMIRNGTHIESQDIQPDMSIKDLASKHGITLAEIGKRAGVGKSVASQVLSGKYPGRPETADRVNAAARAVIDEEIASEAAAGRAS